MAEIIGFISGAASLVKLFHATVQIFDIVNESKEYSAEIHTLCSMLEIERTRLLNWGEVVGLTTVGATGPQPSVDNRLYTRPYRTMIENHLNRLFQLFERADSFLDNHGIRLNTLDEEPQESDMAQTVAETVRLNQVVRPVHKVFPHQLQILRKSIQNHQNSVSWFRKAKWAVYKADRFRKFVTEIRLLVDGLHAVLPDVNPRAINKLVEEIELAEDESSLSVIQMVTAGIHDELAEAASARSEILSVTKSVQGITVAQSEISDAPTVSAGPQNDRKSSQLSDLASSSSVERITAHYTAGALLFESNVSQSRLVSFQAKWFTSSDRLSEGAYGLAEVQHSSFELYYEHSDIYQRDILDTEASRDYLGAMPGTLSTFGYVKECQMYHHALPPSARRPARFSPAAVKNIASDEACLKRYEELKQNEFPLDDDPVRDGELLQEILGDKSLYGRIGVSYPLFEQIEDLITCIDNRRNSFDFGNIFSILAEVIGKNEGRDMANFLSQVVLSKELSRRLQSRNAPPLRSHLLTNSLIISSRFMEGATFTLQDDSNGDRTRTLPEMGVQIVPDKVDKQIEGLVRFAEILKWPFLHTTRDNIEDAALRLTTGESLGASLMDWLYCVVLPGKWASAHIMGALVECTPEVEINTFPYFNGGLYLKDASYWRTTSVLGKVLLTGMTKSAMGWVGPCPTIVSPATVGYVQIMSRKVGPAIVRRNIALKAEDLNEWRDPSRWFVPAPPAVSMAQCRISSIKLKPISTPGVLAFRAALELSLDGTSSEFMLYTNPHFVTPPQCRSGPHKVHDTERHYYENVVEIVDLKEFQINDDDLFIINAQCEGGEAYARAWCAAWGRSAVVASARNCCFTCAVKLASDRGIGFNLLIWCRS